MSCRRRRRARSSVLSCGSSKSRSSLSFHTTGQRGAKCALDEHCDEKQELECIQGRCDFLRGEGLPCDSSADCQEELTCDTDPADSTKQICKPRAALNTPCSSHDQCQSGFCDPASLRLR